MISNAIADQQDRIPNGRNLSDWAWQWAQYLDHDITFADSMDPTEPFDVEAPTGDPIFDPQSTGEMVIRCDR